jgi:hypothetical protein
LGLRDALSGTPDSKLQQVNTTSKGLPKYLAIAIINFLGGARKRYVS